MRKPISDTRVSFSMLINKRQIIPKGQSKMDNPEKLARQGTQDEDKQIKNTTQYVLDTTMRKQTQITLIRHKPYGTYFQKYLSMNTSGSC